MCLRGEAAKEKRRRHQQEQRRRRLRDDQSAAKRESASGLRTGVFVLDRLDHVWSRGLKRRQESEKDPRGDRGGHDETEDAPIDADVEIDR
ncbi:hypothetical protein D3C83_56000 [compost metagenome]